MSKTAVQTRATGSNQGYWFDAKSRSIPIDFHIKMPFTEKNKHVYTNKRFIAKYPFHEKRTMSYELKSRLQNEDDQGSLG